MDLYRYFKNTCLWYGAPLATICLNLLKQILEEVFRKRKETSPFDNLATSLSHTRSDVNKYVVPDFLTREDE
jgi:hypothetical protein